MLIALWLVLMAGAFYLLLWRPQQRRMAMARALQRTLEVGDDVLTTSGIYGRVVRLGEGDADLEIAPGTVVRIARGAIGQVLSDDGGAPGAPDAPGGATETG